MSQLNSIRNFSIIAHINHGKTTLTDRFLEITGTIEKRFMHERFLDTHPISRERGITIKLAPVRMPYILNTNPCILNLIDTPGHIDFSYEVSRSLACCEGAVLLADAVQGIQAQTLSHFRLAQKLGLKIIPVINKIDLTNAQPDKIRDDLTNTFNLKKEEIILVSAKTGENVTQVLEEVIKKIPPPQGQPHQPLRALVFDSFYHPYKGIIVYVRIVDGKLTLGKLKFLASGYPFEPLEIGYLTPAMEKTKELQTGEVGYVATGLKDINLCQIGDTLVQPAIINQQPPIIPLPGYQAIKPVVFFDFYPVENKNFAELEQAIKQLKLNDVALTFSPTGSAALGKGFHLGFLGLLHALITQERLEKDFGLEIVITSPSVEYQIINQDGSVKTIQNSNELSSLSLIKEIKEPWIKISLFTPSKFLGRIFNLCQEHRAKLVEQKYYGSYVNLGYEMPLRELIEGFFDQLKSASSGFASLDYQMAGFRSFPAVKLEVLINKQKIEALSLIVNQEQAERRAKALAKKLKEIIPRQMFEVPIQISLNGRVTARETIKALRKDVTAKLYGGDQTRKDKLLKKQKKGKKRMKQIGRLTVPQEAFLALLKR
jgi:GTP-binding protein LepA